MKIWFAAIALLFAAPALAVAQPQDVSAPGTVLHPAARAGFPERVGEFRRGQVFRFQEGDFGANYDLAQGDDRVRLSVYIYPAPHVSRSQRVSACQEMMQGVTAAIFQQHPDAELNEIGAAPAAPGIEPGLGLRTVHSFRFELRPVGEEDARSESRLYCYVEGDWLVKYRVSSNANAALDVGALIDEFIRIGPWPGRGAGSIALR
jgi:hypothetical protein